MRKRGKLDIYSHFVRFYDFDQQTREAFRYFLRQKLIAKQLVKEMGKWVKKDGKLFCFTSKDKREIRFHINVFAQLSEHLRSFSVDVENDFDKTVHTFKDYFEHPAELHAQPTFVPYDYQVNMIEYILESGRRKILNLATGYGKCLPLDTPVRIPNGWKPIGELKVGDTISAPNGGTTKVVDVFDNGVKSLYKITFEDGREAICSHDHLWKVFDKKSGKWSIVNAEDLNFEYSENPDFCHYYIPMIARHSSADVDLVTQGDIDAFIESYRHATPDEIPANLLNSSFRQRKTLLDKITDLYEFESDSKGSFVTWTEQLGKDLVELIRGLGYQSSYTIGPMGVQVSFDKLPTKLLIKSIEPHGEQEVRCIKVDHQDELYIINDYIVTHNTSTALKAGELIKKRVCVCVLPKYKDKWIEDISKFYEGIRNNPIGQDELLVIDTTAKLDKYIDRGVPEYITAIVLTLTTFRGYIDAYREDPNSVQVPPEQIWEKLGIGYRITDETHEHFHLNYTIDLFTHCPKTLYLSATLDPSGSFEDKMYRTMFPKNERMGGDLYKPYIKAKALIYHHMNPERWRYILKGAYSHIAYEANFMQGRIAETIRIQYFDMIYEQLKENYLDIRKKGQKAIIFFTTIKMCSMFVDYLESKVKDVDIRRYVGEDDYDNILEGEIIVSTTGSAGTAIDIPGLILNIMTISIDSRQANLQIMGRLRELKQWPGQNPLFIYLVGKDLGKPWDYHLKKKQLLKDRVISLDEVDTGVVLRK